MTDAATPADLVYLGIALLLALVWVWLALNDE